MTNIVLIKYLFILTLFWSCVNDSQSKFETGSEPLVASSASEKEDNSSPAIEITTTLDSDGSKDNLNSNETEFPKVRNQEDPLMDSKKQEGNVIRKKKARAKIQFSEKTYDFGEIDEGESITHSFSFKNVGERPLVIKDVEVSCGCTAPSYPFVPIAPGQTGKIDVVFNSKGKFGTQKPSITVISNGEQPQVKLYLNGNVKNVFENTEHIDTVQNQ